MTAITIDDPAFTEILRQAGNRMGGAARDISAPSQAMYTSYCRAHKTQSRDWPTTEQIIAHYGSWAAMGQAQGFEYLGTRRYDELAADLRKQQFERDKLERVAKRGRMEKALSHGLLQPFNVPWRATVYGSTKVMARSEAEALEKFEQLDEQKVMEGADQSKHVSAFVDEIDLAA